MLHAAAAGNIGGGGILAVSEAEADALAKAMAKLIVSRGREKTAAKKIEKNGPLFGLILAFIAIYGPRALMIWKMWQAEKARKARPVAVMPSKDAAGPQPDEQKVN